jgi:hypothetical protein
MFSQAVERVSNTSIFARMTLRNTQILVYAMTLTARSELAMVLPLPTPPRAPEDAVRFINLERYPTYFADMRSGFPSPMIISFSAGGLTSGAAPAPLVVHDVGAFEASFVPTVADFARLDRRFALAPQIFNALPAYRDWGFAVFKLKGFGASARAAQKAIHPMAFELRPRDTRALFFPTVHVHDGVVHETASFDHELYCQLSPEVAPRMTAWEASTQPAASFMNNDKVEGTILGGDPIHRRRLEGLLPNRDQWITFA